MKAAILNRYDKNGTDLAVADIPVPEPAPDEVLVRIHTAAVNPLDNMIVRGEVRLITPYRLPLVMGNEFSGTVVKAGSNARAFKEGDRVYGRMPLAKIGAFAEYAAVDESALAPVPGYLSLEEAACVPLTALTALQALDLMGAQLAQIDRLFPAERPLAVSIDRTFELAQVNEALEAVRTGHSRGKTLLSIHAD